MPYSASSHKTAFVDRLTAGAPILLDGGLSNQLEAQGLDLNSNLWSASLLRDDPTQIVNAHRFYLQAGADCLITASYQASTAGFETIGISPDQGDESIANSVVLAQQAIDQYRQDSTSGAPRRPLVAASIGPYGAFQADGSEYHGNYGVDDAVLAAFHAPRLRLLDSTSADVLACETIPSLQEERVLHRLLLEIDTPAWLCFSCRDGQHVNDGSTIEACVALFNDHPKVAAVGVNCTAPQYVNELIRRIKNAAADKAIVVYPNSGERYDPVDKSWHGTSTPQACGAAAQSWLEAGASIIGGCCRMGPDHIRAMKQQCCC
ncbi:MAG: homocysteine S-methyltransferase [Motiliproteus sp.]